MRLSLPMEPLLQPNYSGKDLYSGPSYSFLIQNASGRNVLFDLGVRKDWQNLNPFISKMISEWSLHVQKDVPEILEENGVSRDSINSIVWSHMHWDHIGDPSLFPETTELVVGPGFKEAFLPGYPTNADSPIRESDYQNRELREIAFDEGENGLRLGRFAAFDFFGDGSFYLLNAPGHTIAHLCALARVSSAPDSFVFMGADVCHHAGEFRPSVYRPLPSMLSSTNVPRLRKTCPGSLFQELQPEKSATKPFYVVQSMLAHDEEMAASSVHNTEEFDADDNILVIIAHDEDILDIVDFFPKDLRDWKVNNSGNRARWAFLKDFFKALNII